MSEQKKDESETKKVFFITSNQSKLNKLLNYEISKGKGLANLQAGDPKAVYREDQAYKREQFSVFINSIEIVQNELKEENRDQKSKKYKAIVNLKNARHTFPGPISFRHTKNNFIYDFEFNEYKGWTSTYYPPPHIAFSKLEQLKLYIKYVKDKLKKKQKDQIYRDLITESQLAVFGKKTYLDFYLEIFKNCYADKEIKLFLKSFKIENILLPENLNYKDYSVILGLLERKPEIISQHCVEKDKKLYYKLFYTLLFYVRFIYEREKANDMVERKNLWEYLIQILPEKSKFFPKLKISEELIQKMFEQELTIEKIIGILSFCGSIEKVLILINDKIEQISDCCIKYKNKILMSSLENPQKTDNLEKIIEEIEKIIKYELNNNKAFISFDKEFWEHYIHFNDDVKRLFLINKAMILCSKIDDNLKNDNLNLNYKIHENGINSIKQGILKNEEILEFIKMDTYFFDDRYQNKYYRTLDIIKGFDFDTMTEQFFKEWDNSNIFKIYSFCLAEFKSRIVNQLTDMKNFGKLLKMFDYKNKNIFDYLLVQNIREKFKGIMGTYKAETCPKFVEEVAYYIYIIDFQKVYDMEKFMTNTIEKYILSPETKRDIYIYLATNYKDLSKKVIEGLTGYLTKNKERLNAKSILFLLEKLNSIKVIESLLDKIDSFVIKEEELFSEEKDIESFQLLEGIQKGELFNKLTMADLNKTKYLMNIFQMQENILKKIKSSEINYNTYKNIFLSKEKKEIFKNKLKILFLNNDEDVEKSMDILKQKCTSIIKVTGYLGLLENIIKEFFPKERKNDLIKIENLNNKIKSGMMNECEKPDTKSQIDDAHLLFPQNEFDKIKKLKNSIFFLQLFRAKKSNDRFYKKESEIFGQTEKDFNELKLLFENTSWMEKIHPSILKECFKSLKNEKKKKLKSELLNLANYFNKEEYKNEKSEKFLKLEGDIQIFNQKEEIFLTSNSCIYFIDELEAEKTDFYKELDKIKNGLLQKSPTIDNIKKYGDILEKNGLKILDPTEDDRECLNILHYTFIRKGSIKFIAKLGDKDIRTIQEMVNMSEDSLITNNDIQDMIKCSTFIGEIKGKKTDKELIKDFIKKVPEKKGIAAHFQNYTNRAGEIKELFLKKLDKSKATLQQIKDIMKNSVFTLTINNNKDPYLNFEGEYENSEKPGTKEKMNYDNIIELRERAMLTRKLGDDKSKEEKEIFNLYKSFSERVNEIEKINQLLKKVGEKGYSENIKVIIDIKDTNPVFSIDDKYVENYTTCSKYLDKLFLKINDIQTRYYRNEELIRYVYGRQFNLLNSCLKKEKNNTLLPFLQFLTNDQINSNQNLRELNFVYDYEKDEDKYKCLFENIKTFLASFLKKNNLKLESIYQNNLIKDEYKEKFVGLFTYLLEDDKIGEVQKGIEEHILNWFNFLTGHPPMAQTVLLCNEETTSEEITAFMHRAFLCQYQVFFMIGKVEQLTSERRQTLTRLINILYSSRKNEMKSCVAFAYSKKEDSLVKALEGITGHEYLKHDDMKKKEQKLYDENVEIISSDRAGVGKSTRIKMKVKEEKKKYIHFPFGGEFTRKDVINRLKKIQNKIENNENTVIHLDLDDSKHEELMKDFLYSFLITKLYGQNENLFYLSKKVKIIIEIPCGFVNFFHKYPLLSMFKNRTEMKIADLPPLIIEKELNSNIQIVCNYIKLLNSNKISEKDLIINEVSLSRDDFKTLIDEDFKIDTAIDAVSLEQKECDKLIKDLIKKELKIEYPTYYQIKSFINVLSGQLKKFSMNFTLSAANLIQYGNILNNHNFKNLREILVKSFIKNTIHFTQGAFDKILTAQQETYKIKIERGNYDANKQEEIAIKALSEPGDIISCNKIDPALVFFHEGEGQDFTIITKENPNRNEYSQLLQLRSNLVKIQNEAYRVNNQDDKIEPEPKELKRYAKFTHPKFLEEIKEILSITNPVYTKDKAINIEKDKNKIDPDKLKLKSIEEIVGEYVFTADNFIKMILILLRIRENIPVIMMGETGCGKTSLIRKLSELINNGDSKMEILNIHAGITDEEIVKFLFEEKEIDGVKYDSIIKKAEKLKEEEEKKYKKYKEKGQKYFKKKLWVFLDEINTCNCMGLICEMMTKHSCQGVELPENIFFIGACNPYRYGTKGADTYALKMKNVQEKTLVYTVNPLPFSLLNFVFNFGNLTPGDEESYINNMVVSPIENFFWREIEAKQKDKQNFKRENMGHYISQEDYTMCQDLKRLSSKAIIEAQNYVRKQNDVSSVSLREIRRFSIFYTFFVEYYRKIKKLYEEMEKKESFGEVDLFYKNLSNREIYVNSIKLSIYLCYYMRLSNKAYRKELADKMNVLFGDNFIEIPEREQKFITKNIEMKIGIAKNRALLENLFTLFTCVNAKVPLFIVGKPGCSKSLSVQLLFDAMKGDASNNLLFKTLPKLFINAFQGSLGSTSKGVLNIFKKARSLLKNNDKDKDNNLDKISMIYFDEMGLAEHSPNNPLKVIHSELEYDLNEGNKKIAFVGISNWVLDASKMNRGLYLSIPAPDIKDLETTAITIAESYNEKLAQDNKSLFIALANTYEEYKEILRTNYTIKEDFHGSRDFYHLIKTAMRQLLQKKEEDNDLLIDENVLQEIGIKSIERNFAGLEFNAGQEGSTTSLELIKKCFKKRFVNCDVRKEYDVIKTICENIKDKESRYLLLVSKSSISNYLLNSILSSEELKTELNKDLSFYIGSGFTKDVHSEGYGLKILNKIQLQMEQNKILLLTDLEAMYPSLYDLFNQNFTVVNQKNYARIAMGSTNNTFSLVNDGFKCIVLYDDQSIEKAMAPFLNRFEKHIISFEYLLSEDFINEAENIYNMIQDFANQNLTENNGININYNLYNLLINCDKEEIHGIIYSQITECKKLGKTLLVQDIQDLVLEKIALTLPQDIIFLLKYSGFEQIYPKIADKIIDFYQKGEHSNLFKFLKAMKNYKNVIYTFTSIDTPITSKFPNEFDTDLLGKIHKNNIYEIPISSLSAENELEAQLEKVYIGEENKIKIVVFKFNPYETDIMNYVKFFIENYIKEKNYIEEDNKKVYIFSVHMNRIFESDENDPKKIGYVKRNQIKETISHLSDFYQIFIDHLGGEDFSIIDIMKYKQEDLFKNCLKLDKEFLKSIYDTFSYFNYDFLINIKGIDKNNYPIKVMKFLENNEEFSKFLINCVLKRPKTEIDIGKIIKKKEYFTKDDVGIISVVQKYLLNLFTDDLTKLIFQLEKDNFLSTFIFNQILNNKNNKAEELPPNNNGDKNKKEEKNKIKEEKNEIKEEKNEIKEEKNEIKEEKNEIKEEKNEIKEEKNEIKEEKNEIKEEKNEIKEEKNKIKEENQEKNYYLNNKLVKILIETYLDNVDFSLNAVKKKIKNNKVSLLMGLRLPGIYIPLKKIVKYIRSEVKDKYFEEERNIIYLRDEEGLDLVYFLNKYKNKVKNQQRNSEIEILKNKIFEKLNGIENEYQKDSREFYELLMEDYYLIYLSENLPKINDLFDKIDIYKNILKMMLHERFNTGDEGEEIDPIKALAKKMVWMETYSQYIFILINLYDKIQDSASETNVFNKMEKLIKNREIILEEDEKRNPHHTLELKSPFYYITEALLKICIDKEMFNNKKGQEFYNYINSLKTITKDCLIIIEELSIYSNEIYTIQEFFEIERGLNNANKSNEENNLYILSILLDISQINKNVFEISKKVKDLSDNLTKLYDFLLKNLGNTENFRELIMKIFVREFRKIKDDKFRLTLLDTILKNENLISYSHNFISLVMDVFLSSEPPYIETTIKNFQEDQGTLLELINSTNNDILNEIILNIFESKINIYFDSIPNLIKEDEEFFPKYYEYKEKNEKTNPTLILSDQSLDIFRDCCNLLETIYNDKKEGKKNIRNDLICQLFAIAYIKIYLYKYVYFSHFHNQEFIHSEEVLKAINGNAKTEVRQMIKIYVFKIFFHILGNYQDFAKYNYKKHQIEFFDELKDRFVEKKEAMLSYYMLPNVDQQKLQIFKDNFEKFDTYKFSDFDKPINEFVNYIINNGIDHYFLISTNLIVSNLALQNYVKDLKEYTKYSSYTKNIFSDPKIKLPEITKKLFFLFSNDETFNNTMKKKIVNEQNLKDINAKQFEILLYALRFCLQTSNCEKTDGLLYSQMITKDCVEKLNSNCIPGNNILDNIYVKNYSFLEYHLNTKPSNYGAYVCPCGVYYEIEPCGFPNASGKCINCGGNIGSGPLPKGITGGHGFAHVPGHYRIFKDLAQKQHEFKICYYDNDQNIPNLLLKDYYERKIKPILDNEKFGVSKITKLVFEDIHQKVRNLSSAGFRLLNFILYSHLFYANCLEFITNEDLSKYVCDGMTCIQMLETNWNLLKDALQSKGIQIIQIFMNLIFDRLSEKLKNCKEIKTIQDREKFEDEIDKLLEGAYKEYDAYAKIYNENNEKMLELDKNSMKSLVLETNDIKSYDEKDYPFYKYFLMTTYPTKEAFEHELRKVPEYEKKYPLLNNYLKENTPQKFLIKYLPEFNEFSNYMIDYYSYKISREDASKRKIKDEDLYKNDIQKFKDKFQSFTEIWEKLKQYATKYSCRDDMKPIDLDENQCVACFLCDNGDIGKGMYIAAAYQNFITWQNNFLDSLIEPLKQSGILHHFVKSMENTIDVQKAKKNETLNFDEINKNFLKYISENCERNIIRKDFTINYMNYKQLIYDFDAIEKNLGEFLLPGKVKFNSYEKLKFVTYTFEGFRGDKSSVLRDFGDKYKQIPLSLEKKQIIYDIITEKYNKQTEELSSILFSFQLLIYYLTQERQKNNEQIQTIIGELPDYVQLSKECTEFLTDKRLKIKFEEIIGVFSFFELLCFNTIINNLQAEYKKDIDINTKKKILELFEGKEKKLELVTKKNLSTACRQFISRYLVSTRKDTDYDEKKELPFNLSMFEFWPESYYDKEAQLMNELNYLKNENNEPIIVGQCFALYNLLGGDEADEMKDIKLKKDEDKEGVIDEEEGRIVVKNRPDKPRRRIARKNIV